MHPWYSDPWFWFSAFLAVLAGILLALLVVPKTRRAISARLVAVMGQAYQKQLAREFQRKFPDLYERFSSFRLSADSQGSLMSAMKRIPPQEGLKLQAEFMRLADNFQQRHPELADFVAALKAQDGRGQAKALQKVFRLPAAQRQAISKDLLWAYDQLAGRFPRWVKMLEATLRGPAEKGARPSEPAGKR